MPSNASEYISNYLNHPTKVDYRNDPSLSIPISDEMRQLFASRPLPTAFQMQNSLLPSIQTGVGMPTPIFNSAGKRA